MYRLLAIFLVVLVAPSVWAQKPEYYPLRPGTRKHFQTTINQNTDVAGQSAISFTVHARNTEEVVGTTKVLDKPATLVRTSRRDSVAGRPMGDTTASYYTENYYQTRPQGVFLLASFGVPAEGVQKPDSNYYEPNLQVLKLPIDSAVGWKVGTMKMQGMSIDLEAQVVGLEDVEVPAGSFKNCLKVRSSSTKASGTLKGPALFSMNVAGGSFTSTSWYAPDVGLVKQEVDSRFIITSPDLPPGMTAVLTFKQNMEVTQLEQVLEEKKTTKKK